MKSIKKIKDLDPADFIIKWRLTNMCNADCSYCVRKPQHKTLDKDTIEKDELNLCEIAKEVSRLIDNSNFNNVKIDLIGGEVTLFNLQTILENIKTDKLKVINITSNVLKDLSYFTDLCNYLHKRNIKLTLTASYHFEYISFENYFEKVKALNENVDFFCCEMVSLPDNQELCKRFIDECKKNNLIYRCEVDIRFGKEDVRKLNLIADSNKQENARYEVTFTDGSKQIYTTRNQLLIDRTIKENVNQNVIQTNGMMCTKNYDFIYIDFDIVGGRTNNTNSCLTKTRIQDFNLIAPKPCTAKGCTLCGHMDLWRV